jgi:hypothetical protein
MLRDSFVVGGGFGGVVKTRPCAQDDVVGFIKLLDYEGSSDSSS